MAVVQSGGSTLAVSVEQLAEITPLYGDANYYADTTLALSGTWAHYGQIYRSQAWVYAVLRKIAVSTARLPFKVYSRGDTGREDARDTPFGELMRKPHPQLDPYSLWLWTASTFEIYGEAIWVKFRDEGGTVRMLQPMHPSNTVIHRKPNGETEYLFTSGTRQALILPPFPASDIVHFKGYHPESQTRGLSQLEPLRQTLLNEDATRRATAAFWANGARPSVTLTHPGTLSEDAAKRLKAGWDNVHSGVDSFGKTAVLEEGMTPNILQLNLEEMQYIESRKLNREEVCGVCDVPPPVVHILDRATFSNITEQMRSMYRDTMAPRLGLYESAIDLQLRPDFDGTGGLYGEFMLDEVLRGSFEERAASYQTAINAGYMSPAEVRSKENLPDAGPAAEKLFINSTLAPLDDIANPPPPPAPSPPPVVPPVAPEPPPAASPSNRALARRLGQVKANPKLLRRRLVREHETALAGFFEKQRAAVLASMGGKAFDPTEWDDELASTIVPLSVATATTYGKNTASRLKSPFDTAGFDGWATVHAQETAKRVNQKTADDLDVAFDAEDPEAAVEGVFDDAADGRATQIANTLVTALAAFGAMDAAKQSGAGSKTWVVNSDRPRASHAAMAGETVGLDETFSNGLRHPGDGSGDVDEVAGCTCSLDFTTEGS
jgi:HK97 family phage portal protein